MLRDMVLIKGAFGADKHKTPLSVAVMLFRIYNQSEGKSARTLQWYEHRLSLFIRGFGPDVPIGRFEEALLRAHIAGYQTNAYTGEPLHVSSINNHARALRAFFHWAYREGYTQEHLLGRYRPPKIPQELIEPLTDDEIKTLLSAARRRPRDYAMCALFLDTGLRAFELCGLTVDGVNLEMGWVKVMGKGAKERMVPFGDRARKILIDYVRDERPHARANDRVFLKANGRPISPDTVRQIMERLARRSGIRRLHAHLLRHTFATDFLLNGGAALLLKQLLGHTTLTMVDRYVHVSNMKAIEVSRDFSPLDRLGEGKSQAGSWGRNGGWPGAGGKRPIEADFLKLSRDKPDFSGRRKR